MDHPQQSGPDYGAGTKVAVGEQQAPALSARNNSSSLRRALRIVSFVAENRTHSRGVILTEIANGLQISKSTVLRLLGPLCDEGLLVQDIESGRYQLGPQTAYLGQLYLERLDLPSVARDQLESLGRECNETVHLVVLDGVDVVYIDKFEAPQAVRMFSRIGTRQPAYCTGVGKAYLAYADEELVQKVVDAGMHRRTPSTITTESALRKEMAAIRARGYAVDNIENEQGIRCVASPIFDHRDKVTASMSVSGPASRITPARVPQLAASLVPVADEISRRLGSSRRAVD